ncbi:hypothetical protein MMPV_007104 [Pyropia vietnamensis]
MSPAAPPLAGPAPPRRLNTAMVTNSGTSVFPVASWMARTGRLRPPSSAIPGVLGGGMLRVAPSGPSGASTVAYIGGDSDAYNRRMARRSRVEAVEAAVGTVSGAAGAASSSNASTAGHTGAESPASGGAPGPDGTSSRPPAGFYGANTATYGRRWRVLAEVAAANHAASSRGFVRVAANGAEYDRRMLVRNESS